MNDQRNGHSLLYPENASNHKGLWIAPGHKATIRGIPGVWIGAFDHAMTHNHGPIRPPGGGGEPPSHPADIYTSCCAKNI